jgi:hypothetical protein
MKVELCSANTLQNLANSVSQQVQLTDNEPYIEEAIPLYTCHSEGNAQTLRRRRTREKENDDSIEGNKGKSEEEEDNTSMIGTISNINTSMNDDDDDDDDNNNNNNNKNNENNENNNNNNNKNENNLNNVYSIVNKKTTEERCNEYKFDAERITKGDYFLKGYEHNVRVSVDVDHRRLIVSVPKEQTYSITQNESLDIIVIDWDNISGLDFQYLPGQPTIVVIELFRAPVQCPKHFSSVVYFLYCRKQDCATYLDDIMLRRDQRLLELSIKSLPTWSVIVNRYSIPIYYSYRIRKIVTTLVNIYIFVSLIWGFYDLYKHLPFVGVAVRRIFGPMVGWIEPFFRNRILLLVPLLLNRLFVVVKNIFSTIIPLVRTVFEPLVNLLSGPMTAFLENVLYPLLDPIIWLGYSLFGTIVMILTFIYQLILPIFNLLGWILMNIVELFKLLGTSLFTLASIPIQLLVSLWNLVGAFFYELYEWACWLWNSQLQVISLIFNSILYFVKCVVYYPFNKLYALFSTLNNKIDVEHAKEAMNTVSHIMNKASDTTVKTSSASHGIKHYLDIVKEDVKPVSYIYTGARRIIDSVIYTYHGAIKHRSTWMKRLLIALLILGITSALILIIMLVL